MKRYLELWDEIDAKRGKDGATDSAAVQEANEIAIELAQYDGIMAEVFSDMAVGINAAISADSTDTIEDVKMNIIRTLGGGVSGKTTGANCPYCKSRKDCGNYCADKKREATKDMAVETAINAAVCWGLGAAGQVVSIASGGLWV